MAAGTSTTACRSQRDRGRSMSRRSIASSGVSFAEKFACPGITASGFMSLTRDAVDQPRSVAPPSSGSG